MKLVRWASLALAVFTLLLTIVFFIWWAGKDRIVFGDEKFDQVGWMQGATTIQTECKRGDMAYDLQQHLLKKGLLRAHVTELLGRPNYEDTSAIEYDLGKCMHVYHGLRIFFDKHDRLIHSRISSH